MSQTNLPEQRDGRAFQPASDPRVIAAALRNLQGETVLSPAALSRLTAASITAKRAQLAVRQRESPLRRFVRALTALDARWSRGWALPVGAAIAAAVAFAFAAYVLVGGTPGPGYITAESNGAYVVRQRRTALIFSWLDVSTVPGGISTLGGGDVVAASQPLTLTFPDGTVSVLQGGTEVALLLNRPGFELRRGEAESSIGPAAQTREDGAKFSVVTRRGTYLDQGTVFRTRSSDDDDFIGTDEGEVAAGVQTRSGDLLNAQVRSREELVVPNNLTRLEVQLQAPRVRIVAFDGTLVAPGAVTASPKVTVTGLAFPGGVLDVTGGIAPAQAIVGANGRFALSLGLPEGEVKLRLTIRAGDGRSRSADVAFDVDSIPPALSFLARAVPGNRVAYLGQTEPGATVTVEGAKIEVGPSGAFAGELALPAGGQIIALAADRAGNVTSAVTTPDR